MTNEQASDAKFLIGQYLTEGDVTYRRLLDGLSNNQMRHTCGAFVQTMAFGSEREGIPHSLSGGFPATCARQAILAGLSEGNSLLKGDLEQES